jgi:hypothetical protein
MAFRFCTTSCRPPTVGLWRARMGELIGAFEPADVLVFALEDATMFALSDAAGGGALEILLDWASRRALTAPMA